MAVKIGIVMDPIQTIHPEKDTSLALMIAARKMGADLYYMEPDNLYIKDAHAFAKMYPVEVFDNLEKYHALGEPRESPLTDLDIVLMRKDPPVNKRFIHTCTMLEQAARDGVRVLNNPTQLIGLNEKIFASHFPELCPPTLIASQKNALRNFLDEHGKIVIKPLDSMGGDGIFMVERHDVNFDVIWETQTARGTYPVMAQRFLPEIAQGDRRVVVIDGEPFGHTLVRTPQTGSIRGNMAAGGNIRVEKITPREHEIARIVGPVLKSKGIVFAGLDVIGNYLTEINITSPTGIRQISAGCGIDIADLIIQKIIHADS